VSSSESSPEPIAMEGVYSSIECISQQSVWMFETVHANERTVDKLAMEFYDKNNLGIFRE
jgi:hypothetical protein